MDVRRNLIWHFTFGVPRSTGPQHHNRHLTGLWRFGLAGPLREERLLVLIPSPPLDGNLRTFGINGVETTSTGGLDRHQQSNAHDALKVNMGLLFGGVFSFQPS